MQTQPDGRTIDDSTIAEAVLSLEDDGDDVTVRVSNEIVALLSEQLYQSPLKAIEELVVNSFDAEASECRVAVPVTPNEPHGFVLVYDDGHGMTREGMVDLWQVGRSKKRESETKDGDRPRRKQIGKFGIGKLATYSIANKVTYISKTEGTVLAVTLDFRRFSHDPSGAGDPVSLSIHEVAASTGFQSSERLRQVCAAAGIDSSELFTKSKPTWTLAILEDLKSNKAIHMRRLRWVLSTAMPLRDDFRLYLNGELVESSKLAEDPLVSFVLAQLPETRLESLRRITGEDWIVRDEKLICSSFPNGVSGRVTVSRRTLHSGKSSELGRSYGFFVRVRGRLVNEDDPLFGLKPRSFTTFYRFQAFLDADDLDADITAPRENVGASGRTENFQQLLGAVFNEA
jgi:hypothetical protein